MVCQVIVSFEQNFKKPIDVCKQEKELKRIPVQFLIDKIQELRPEIEKFLMGLIYKAKPMKEDRTLADYGIKHKSEVQVVVRCNGGLELIVHDSDPLKTGVELIRVNKQEENNDAVCWKDDAC